MSLTGYFGYGLTARDDGEDVRCCKTCICVSLQLFGRRTARLMMSIKSTVDVAGATAATGGRCTFAGRQSKAVQYGRRELAGRAWSIVNTEHSRQKTRAF